MGNAQGVSAPEAAGVLHVESDEELRRPLDEELSVDATPAAARKDPHGEAGWPAWLWCHVACATCCQLVRGPRLAEPGAPEEAQRPARVVLWAGLCKTSLLERAPRGRDEVASPQPAAEGVSVNELVVRGSRLRVYDVVGATPAGWRRHLGQAHGIVYVVDARLGPAALAEALLPLRDLLRDNLVSRFVPVLVLGDKADDEAAEAPTSRLDQPVLERAVRDVLDRLLPYAWAVFIVSGTQRRGLSPALEWLAKSTGA
jgi:hypothetical protein